MQRYAFTVMSVLLSIIWILYVHFARVKGTSLDAKMPLPGWQALYGLRLPFALTLIGITVSQWWSTGNASGNSGRHGRSWQRLLHARPVFFFFGFLTLLLCRWDRLAGNELGFDASQSIVAARTIQQDPRFWVSVDVGTHGPLVSLTQLFLPLFGLDIDYAGSRLLAVVISFVGLCCLFLVIRRLTDESTSRCVLLPSVFLVCGLRFADFVEYNGEYPIILCMMLAVACLASAFFSEVQNSATPTVGLVPEKHTVKMLLLAGIFIGLIPWAKVQGVPIAAVLFVLGVGASLFVNREAAGAKETAVRCTTFCFGAVLPTVLLLAWLLYNHAFGLMCDSYVGWNLAYARRNELSFISKFANVQDLLTEFAFKSSLFHAWLQPIAMLSLYLTVRGLVNRNSGSRLPVVAVAAVAMLVVCVLCVVVPGNRFDHYLMLLLFPLCLVYSLLWLSLFAKSASDPTPARSKGAGYFLVGAVLIPFLFWGLLPPEAFGAGQMLSPFSVAYSIGQQGDPGEENAVVSHLQELTAPGDYVGVWGWRPELLVLTHTRSATRSCFTLREAIRELPMNEHFLRLFVQDLESNKPVVFVDNMHAFDQTVRAYQEIRGANSHLPKRDPTAFRYENYPMLKEWVDTNYDLNSESISGVRIFTRKDRATPPRRSVHSGLDSHLAAKED